MPKIESWDNLPAGVRQHLIDRMRDRAITIPDLNRLRLWIESKPEVPEGDWYKDFGSFKVCGSRLLTSHSWLLGKAADLKKRGLRYNFVLSSWFLNLGNLCNLWTHSGSWLPVSDSSVVSAEL